MDRVRALLEELRIAFARLTQREQMIAVGGAAGGGLLILLIIAVVFASAISRAEDRVQSKTKALTEVLVLQGDYKGRKRAGQERMRKLRGKSRVRLVKLVEDAANAAGVSIGQLTPEDGEPNEEGVIESRVQLRANGLSIDRLQDFLSRLENSPGIVIVRRLKISKPYRKDTLDIDVLVTSFKIKS